MAENIQTEIIKRVVDGREQTIKQTFIEVQVRQAVINRRAWSKWGDDVKDLPRGTKKEGDMLEEAELRIQSSNNQEEYNFVVPAPKQLFVVDFEKKDEKQTQQQQSQPATRAIGEQISFGQGGETTSSAQWLLIVSNVVQLEGAETYPEIIRVKDEFRAWLRAQLQQEESKYSYFINFLQNKRKPKIYQGLDKTVYHHPLIQKVMLKFSDHSKAEQAFQKLQGKSYEQCLLSLELQEQRNIK